MITSELFTKQVDINRIIPECIDLARAGEAYLPFQYMHMPLAWWDSFNNNGTGFLFGQKRGANFLGVQSRLEEFFLLIGRDGGSLCGAVPLASYTLKMPNGQGELGIITFAGDFLLLPFQDFLVESSRRQEVISSFLERIAQFLKAGCSFFWAGHLPEESPNLAALRASCAALQGHHIASLEAISCQRGGVWPWTIGGISATLKKIGETCDTLGITFNGQEELASKIAAYVPQPQSLLFPGTRNKLLHELNTFISRIDRHEPLAGFAKRFDSFLKNSPLLYPCIELPADREEYLGSLSYSTRRYFRRYLGKFLAAGGNFEIVRPDEITAEDIEDYIRLHLLRWGNGSHAICGESADYHRTISAAMAQQGLFLLFFARYQGKRIAVHSCFDIGSRREGYLTGRDPDYQELRAGRLLYIQTIFDAIDKGFSRYELGGGGFGYKMSFVKKTTMAHNFFLYPADQELHLDQIFLGFECMEPVLV